MEAGSPQPHKLYCKPEPQLTVPEPQCGAYGECTEPQQEVTSPTEPQLTVPMESQALLNLRDSTEPQ